MNTIEQLKEHFETRRDSLVKIAQRRLGEFWAEDAVQDAYERVIRYSDSFIIGRVMDSYIKKVLEYVILRYERENFSTEEVEEWMWESGELADEMRGKGCLSKIVQEVAEMEEPQRSCIYLYVIQGEKDYTTSRITGIPVRTIQQWAYRFRKQMREKYGEED